MAGGRTESERGQVKPPDPAPGRVLYSGVLAVGIVGAARLRPIGMARALDAMAVTQALIGAVAVAAGLGYPWSPALELLLLNGFLVAAFAGSAWLYRRAARGREEMDASYPRTWGP